jgi:hypothetical protein
MTIFQNLILFTNHYENLQEMLEMASFLKYVDLYLTSERGRFYVGHSVYYVLIYVSLLLVTSQLVSINIFMNFCFLARSNVKINDLKATLFLLLIRWHCDGPVHYSYKLHCFGGDISSGIGYKANPW